MGNSTTSDSADEKAAGTHIHGPDGPESCFSCKIKSLRFGVVPGGYRAANSQSYYDPEALPDFPGKEEVKDMQRDYHNAPVKEVKVEDLGIN